MLNQKGVTLVELLVGMAIFVIILGGMYEVLTAMTRAQQYNFEEAGNIEGERAILNSISSEIRNAINISSPIVGNTDNVIRYKKSGDSNYRTITIGQNSDANTVIFTDTSETTILRYGQGRTNQLSFQRTSANAITIELTLKNTINSNSPANTISTIVHTLNSLN